MVSHPRPAANGVAICAIPALDRVSECCVLVILPLLAPAPIGLNKPAPLLRELPAT
jgi:hypothetical protein